MATELTTPNDAEAERAIIGSVIVNNEIYFEVCRTLKPEVFFQESNRLIWDGISGLMDSKNPVDEITLGDWLKSKGKLESIGGYAYLSELTINTPASGKVSFWAEIIYEHFLMRQLIKISSDIGRKSRDPQQSVTGLLIEVEQKIQEIAGFRNRETAIHIKDVLTENFRKLEEVSKNPEKSEGIRTGFQKIDNLTYGLRPSKYIIVAARPSMGKTAFALNIAGHVGINDKTPGDILIFSREMDKHELVDRMLSSTGSISSFFLKTGRPAENDPHVWDRLSGAADKLSAVNILFNDQTREIDQIIYSAKQLHRSRPGGLKLIIADYLQRFTPVRKRSREEEIADMSSKFADLSHDLNIPVIVLSQLNRSLESRTDKRPQLADLRDSGSIEQDADIIIFIYRDEYYTKQNCERPGIAEFDIAKHRGGPTGMIELKWNPKITKFSNL